MKVSFQGMLPRPGTPRSFSEMWICTMRSLFRVIGADRVGLFDIAWNVSYMALMFGWSDRVDMLREVGHRVDQVAFEAVERLEPDGHAVLACMIADRPLRGDGAASSRRGRPACRKTCRASNAAARYSIVAPSASLQSIAHFT